MSEFTVLGIVAANSTPQPDLTLDGRPVGAFAGDADPPNPLDIYSAPWAEWPAFLLSLLGEEPSVEGSMLPGRIAVACCASCGDASCGILYGAQLVRSERTVQWRNAQWEVETDRPLPPPSTSLARLARRAGFGATHEFAGWKPGIGRVRTVTFDREQYDAVIREALRALPNSPAP
ncbi:hypothetical protein C1I63_05185 [Rathayibacter caricis DSM 15933]|uniref:Uncharacterized protein n=1 Tax=Rathayibacter caricis DSM 15933 TaxID=1328867 RepID=A0A2T4URZ3_9MICO|nr:hypothetical protein [Rathayibacter caricis]PTL72298.1 hypothetical protein C1I63_05185 [Rathayibacter caricis DSM 15933]